MTDKQAGNSLIEESLSLAEKIQATANSLISKRDRKIQDQIKSFLRDPMEKVQFIQLIDQGLRIRDRMLAAKYIARLLRNEGIPSFLTPVQRFLTLLFLAVGRFFPFISVPAMHRYVRVETRHIILPAEEKPLKKYLRKRSRAGILVNVNRLGEAVLGEKEAASRFRDYIGDIKNPDIQFVSVKISGILSQIRPIAFEHNLRLVKERLTELFRASRDHGTFVNIDMEEYGDVEITVRCFMEVLDADEFFGLSAGIALQSYIPDSSQWQMEITEWARSRKKRGGSPVKIRLVKGANLEMELFESELMNWPLPIYGSKLEVDAHYKAMVEYGLRPENIDAVHFGIASHNVFDLAYACALAEKNGVHEHVTIEILEGMADHVRRGLTLLARENMIPDITILLYAPVVEREHFINAMAYLMRRLDENTAGENFLRHSFDLVPGSGEWDFLKRQFLDSHEIKGGVQLEPRRTQDRRSEDFPDRGAFHTGVFTNEPDTDWSLPGNRLWAESIREKWKAGPGNRPDRIPVVVGGVEVYEDRETGRSIERMAPDGSVVTAEFVLGNEGDIEKAIETARRDPDGWRDLSHSERHRYLSLAAVELRRARGNLIGAMAANTGKVFTESDPEVSEAVDFTEFYPHSVEQLEELPGLEFRGRGVGLVISPWNFPAAIPTGGVAAALASGNTVIFKPSSESVLVAWLLAECFWRAGISKNALQFLPCGSRLAGTRLANSPHIDFIIFTGGTETALKIINGRPDLYVAAETGGKNATIVTAMADYDQAVGNIIHSAFSNSGQKCSATSLVILTKEVFRDRGFRRQFLDAVETYRAGSPWNFENSMGPLINPPEGDLKKGIDELEPGESWAIEPEQIDGNPYLLKPAVKWNVRPGSHCHLTELFGPVASVMEAKDLDGAIEIVNATGYGLTSGLESLDENEQETWKSGIRAGNLYINRVTTGAVVLRQPFGGMGKSAFGSGIKAGSPNYTSQFMEYRETGPPSTGPVTIDHPIIEALTDLEGAAGTVEWEWLRGELPAVREAVMSYLWNFQEIFSRETDYFKLRGQDNILRYLPLEKIAVRVSENDNPFSVLARIAAARIAGCSLMVSVPPGLDNNLTGFLSNERGRTWTGGPGVILQDDAELASLFEELSLARYGSPEAVPEYIYREAAKTGFYISREPVLKEGRIELLQYFQEQSISHNYHRYGNLGKRGIQTS